MTGLLDEVHRPVGRLSARRQLWLGAQALRMVWSSARSDFCLVVIGALVQGGGAAVQVVMTNAALQEVMAADTGLPSTALTYLLVLVVVTAGLKLTSSFQTERERVVGELVSRRAQTQVMDAAARLRLESFEKPDFYNRLERATMTAEFRPMQLASGLLGAINSGVAALGVLVALIVLNPLLGVLLLASAIPLWIATGRANRLLYAFNYRMTHQDRTRSYLSALITSRENAAELRICQATPFLRGYVDRLYDARIDGVRTMTRRRLTAATLGNLANAVIVGAVMLLAGLMVAREWMTVAQAGAAFVAIVLVSQRLVAAAHSVLQLHESILFVEDLVGFLDAGPDPVAAERPPRHSESTALGTIALKDVHFRYPSRADDTLLGIDLDVEAGQVIALVGENGSGKSTLAKLIAGLYQPTAGAVCWDGEAMDENNSRHRRGQVSAVFQDFVQYHLSVTDNIAMGRPERRDDHAAIREAARRARAAEFIEALPDGYDTQLGSQFLGGVELSGGQWQRLALARAFFRDAQLLILDEPTSALDPRAERELFDDIRMLCAGRTIVLISHRFANLRSADCIHVLAEGRIIESGSHEQLMDRGGRYAELFTMQADSYRLKGAER